MKKYFLIITILFSIAINFSAQTVDSMRTAKDSNTVSSADSIIIKSTSKHKDSSKSIIDSVASEDDSSITQPLKESAKKLIPPVNDEIGRIFSASKIIWSIIILALGFYIIKLLTSMLNKISERSTSYRITLKGLIPVVRILGWTGILTFIIVGIFAPPVQTVLVVSGSLGIAVGFAAQDILKNIFGGIMILFDRPFQVGDKIQVGSHYGEVTNIGLRSIRMVTADDSMVSVPNGEIMLQSISNSNSGEANCQVVSEFFLPPHIDIEIAREIAVRCAQVSRYAFLNKPISVIFKNEVVQNRPLLKMRLKAYVLDIRYEFAFMSDMTEKTLKEFVKHNIVTKEELNGIQKIEKY